MTSMVTPDGKRSMASDQVAGVDFAALDLDGAWFDGCAWLHLSGYGLFGDRSAAAAIGASELARQCGAAIGVDLSSALLVPTTGRDLVRRSIEGCGTTLVFANAAEHEAAGPTDVAQTVVKCGADGYALVDAGGEHARGALPLTVVRDTTGAGDAFAAGWLLGGLSLALGAARGCIATTGAMLPRTGIDGLGPRCPRPS